MNEIFVRGYLILALICFGLSAKSQVFKGTVKDAGTKEGIPWATIYFPDLNAGIATDGNGVFEIDDYPSNIGHLNLSCLGYENKYLEIDFSQVKEMIIFLTPSHFNLEEVVVSVPGGKLQKENIVLIERKNMEALTLGNPSTLAAAITRIPGVDQSTTGSGIGKPVIRGLSGNRIITYTQGIRIENQQWGDEHGLGVGGAGIGSVEVIKGPASLLYGSDALGGVLYFVDQPYARHKHSEGYFQSAYQSNSLGWSNEGGFKINTGNFKWNIFGANDSNADYSTPDDNRVFNTRYREKNIKTSLGYATSSWITNLRYAYLNNIYGITEEDQIFSSSTERKKELPFQDIKNHNLSWENLIFIGNSKIQSVVGYTGNIRQEFEEEDNNAALEMHLNTFTYNVKWYAPTINESLDIIIGSQGMHQTNENYGEELLIPDGNTSDAGLFAIFNYNIQDLVFQGGLRGDYRSIDTKEFRESQEVLFPAYNNDFRSLNFSFGTSYSRNKLKLRANISSGFRAPNTSELLSNGIHEGTDQYVLGNPALESEKATQIDLSISHKDEHLDIYANFFYNKIKDYIFLSPTGEEKEEAELYEYLQSDARLYGGEWGLHFHPHDIHWLHVQSDVSTVFGRYNEDQNLPMVPATKINTFFRADIANPTFLKSAYLEHVYRMSQNRVSENETTTPSYHLLNAGIKLELNSIPIEIDLGVNNMLNTDFIDHLSRLKSLDVPNPGRNFFVGIAWKFENSLTD